eukprot:TRINITY_DN65989_c5_g1_i2.p1 TRINITY_DN65989_c5_g1~~TRINITY_DN65989_c5_g1_i2.p1  ORF type:complete len:370 (+),score=172.44 TRINITY_DN65989_c5_g1_i2:176-1285(+)
MRIVGLALGVAMIALFGVLTFYTLHCLLVASERTGQTAFNEISRVCFGDRWATVTDVVLILNLLGLAIGFLVVIKGIVGAGLDTYAPDCHMSMAMCYRNVILMLLVFLLVLPLGLLPNLRSLSFTSLLGFFWVMFLLSAVVVFFFADGHLADVRWGELEMANWENFVDGVPYVVYVYLCHPNVLPVYEALTRPTPKRMYKVLRRVLALAAFVYIVVAVFVYLTFQNHVFSNFIVNNFHKDVKVTVGAFGFAFSLVIGTPVYVHTGRTIMDRLLFPGREYSLFRLRACGIVFLAFCVCVTLPVNDLSKVLGIVGASTSPIVSFILPPAYLIHLVPEPERRWERYGAWIIMLAVGSLSAVSLVKQIIQLSS